MLRLICVIALLVGIGGVVYGYEQNQKRNSEREEYERDLAEMEARLGDIEAQFWRQAEEHEAMAAEIGRLRRNAANAADVDSLLAAHKYAEAIAEYVKVRGGDVSFLEIEDLLDRHLRAEMSTVRDNV